MQAATAAAAPLDDPPGERDASCGFVVGPALPIAYSVDTVVPRITAPAARSRATTGASRVGTRSSWIEVPQAQCRFATSMISFTATGTPCNAPRRSLGVRSRARASASAASGATRSRKARTRGSDDAMRARHADTRSSERSSPRPIAAAASATPRLARSLTDAPDHRSRSFSTTLRRAGSRSGAPVGEIGRR